MKISFLKINLYQNKLDKIVVNNKNIWMKLYFAKKMNFFSKVLMGYYY